MSQLEIDESTRYAATAEVVARIALTEQWDTLAHTTRVVARLVRCDVSDEVLAIAWLHDVLEDTPVVAQDLLDVGLSHGIVKTVQLLTRDPSISYREYFKAILADPSVVGTIARVVKYADAMDNMKRCMDPGAAPKWRRLGETRYLPVICSLREAGASLPEKGNLTDAQAPA